MRRPFERAPFQKAELTKSPRGWPRSPSRNSSQPYGRMHPGDTLVFGHMSKPFGQVVCKGMRGLVHPRDIVQVTRCCRRPAQPVASAVLVVVPSSSSSSSSFSFFASLRAWFAYRPFSLSRTRSSLYSPSASTRSLPGPLPVIRDTRGVKSIRCASAPSCLLSLALLVNISALQPKCIELALA